MGAKLEGKNVLIITQNWGVEEVELMQPLEALKGDGANVTLGAGKAEDIECFTSDRYPGKVVTPDIAYAEAKADGYDLLIIPGGTCNVDRLRIDPAAQELARDFAAGGKTIAAICHGPWLLVNAGLVEGRTLTSCPYIVQDLINAGGNYVDKELVTEERDGWKLVTSRLPCDLKAFIGGIEAALE